MIRRRNLYFLFEIVLLFTILSCSTLLTNQQPYDLNNNMSFIKGNEYVSDGNYEKAIEYFDKAIYEIPNCSECYLLRGSAYYQLWLMYSNAPPMLHGYPNPDIRKANRCYINAKNDLSAAVKYNPRSVRAHIERGMFRCDCGDLKGGIKDYNEALNIDPENPEVYFLRGQAADFLGNKERNSKNDDKANKFYDIAIFDYLEAMELDKRYCTARKSVSAHCHTMGDVDTAIALYSKIIEIDPSQGYAYIFLVLAYNEKGDLKNALHIMGKLVEIDDRNLDQFVIMSNCLMERCDYDSAIIITTIAINATKYNKDSLSRLYYSRARAEYEVGKYQEALSDWKKSMSLNSDDIFGRAKKFRDEIEKKINETK